MQSAKNGWRKKISLERYMDFLQSRPRIDLPVYDLDQIISLHGFRKLDRTPKKILTEALEKLDLIDLSRSTIDGSSEISSSASITLGDLVDDLHKLNWQECRVTSVQTFHSSKGGKASTAPADSCPQSVSKDAGRARNSTWTVQAADLSSTRLPKSKKRKSKSLSCIGGSASESAELSTGPAAESMQQSAAAVATRTRNSSGRVVSSLPAHLSTGPVPESKKKQTTATLKRSR